MRITSDSTCAILVDIQERLFPHIFEHNNLANNAVKLLTGLELLKIPTFVTEQYTRGLGTTIPALQQLFSQWQPFEKITFSAAGCSELATKLKEKSFKNIILFGIEAHICVLQSAIDLRAMGYNVVVVEDCTSSRRESDKMTALKRLQAEGVVLTSLESILFELCRTADAPVFKQISTLVK